MLKFLSKVKITVTKNNAREERAIAAKATEDICDTQNNIDVSHTKNDAKKPDNHLYHNLSKDTKQ